MFVIKNCKVCKQPHTVKAADLKRGWGECCSKSCAATLSNRRTGKYKKYLEVKRVMSGQGFVPLGITDHDPNKDRY